mgnify:CR=1 FL=1
MADKKESNITAATSLASGDFLRTVTSGGASSKITSQNALLNMLENCSVNFKNSVYRGASLGSSFTSAQQTAISNGTFTGLWLGDYWTINSVNWRIWDFDYFIGKGDSNTTTHHCVILPDTNLLVADGSTTHYMNDTNTTEGGYKNSKCRTTYLTDTTTTTYPYYKIQAAFGSSHILSHKEYISNAVSSGAASGGEWVTSQVEIPTESMMYGGRVNSNGGLYNVGVCWSQLALARLKPSFVANRSNYWLRDVVSAPVFARVDTYGYAATNSASAAWTGVRPYFLLS